MTYILLTLFVYGVHKVIWSYADFFDFDVDYFYHWRTDRSHPAEYSERPLWQKLLFKPLFYCNVCMSSLWGTVCYFLILDLRAIDLWILHCVISAGLITIINRFMER